jgi:hypothetical protein
MRQPLSQRQQMAILKNNMKGITEMFRHQYDEYRGQYHQLRQNFSSQSRSTMMDLYHKTLDLKEDLNRFLIVLENPNVRTRFPSLQQLKSYLTPEIRQRHANFLENYREQKVAVLYGTVDNLCRHIHGLLRPSSSRR